jgi:hypothetical protein
MVFSNRRLAMPSENTVLVKLLFTILITVYVVVGATIYYPLAIYTLMAEMLDHVWNERSSELHV